MKRLWWLTLVVVLPVRAEIFSVDVEGEIQQQDLLCWAAVSVMAMRAFEPPPPQKRQPTQRDMVFFRTSPTLPPACITPANCPMTGAPISRTCPSDLSGNCNTAEFPWVFDLKRKFVSKTHPGGTHMLARETISYELERKKPILIRWKYLDPDLLTDEHREEHCLHEGEDECAGNDDPRKGNHALIITAYDTVEKLVRVWDPWPPRPDPTRNEPGPTDTHVKWLSYSRYANPLNDQGRPVEALHGSDMFALRRIPDGDDAEFYASMNDEKFEEVPDIHTPQNTSMDFINGPPDVRGPVERFLSGYTARDASGRPIQGQVRADLAVPIVDIATSALLKARGKPESLLQSRTSAMVVPIMQGERLVDSILMLHQDDGTPEGLWTEGGYSNNEIARLLVTLRGKFTNGQRAAKGFYLVSIPQEGAFYLAHGFQRSARLVSLGQGGKGNLRRASSQLGALIKEIDSREALHQRDMHRPR